MENNPIKKPEIVVFAGPNGSGKSTITDLLRPPMLPYVNADEIQRVLDCDNMEACLLYTSPSPRDRTRSRMPSSA